MSTPFTITGNLVADPELRYTPTGVAVASFRIASTDRKRQDDGTWIDGDSIFLTCSAWREMAENVCNSLTKGTRVVVTGRLKQRSFETREGEKRTVFEVECDDVAPSLKNATAKVQRAERSRPQPGSTAAAEDPWSAGASGASDEPPF